MMLLGMKYSLVLTCEILGETTDEHRGAACNLQSVYKTGYICVFNNGKWV